MDHLGDPELLIVEVKHRRIEFDQRTAFHFSAADAAVLMKRKPSAFEPESHPHFVSDVLCIVRVEVDGAMNQPSSLDEPSGNVLAEATI